jgi:sulfur-carrier protein adenylyltransferase/sulfurtransferase
MVGEVGPRELASELAAGRRPVLLDVREADELEISRLEGIVHVPMGEIADRYGELDPAAPTVVVCRTGNRSGRVAAFLVAQGFTDVRNLVGGMNAWAEQVDRSMPTY